jgi:hypothetical protein
VVAYAELGKSGREVSRIAREEVSMNAVKYTFDLRTTYSLNVSIVNITHQEGDVTVREEVLGCRMNELSLELSNTE